MNGRPIERTAGALNWAAAASLLLAIFTAIATIRLVQQAGGQTFGIYLIETSQAVIPWLVTGALLWGSASVVRAVLASSGGD